MNRLLKNVNTFGLMGVLLAGGLVFTQSAFKPAIDNNKTTVVYGYDPSNPTQPWVADGTPGYACVSSTNICKYTFDTPPSNEIPRTLPSEGTPFGEGSQAFGSYRLVD